METPRAPGPPRPGLAGEVRDSVLLLGLLLAVLLLVLGLTAGLSALLLTVR